MPNKTRVFLTRAQYDALLNDSLLDGLSHLAKSRWSEAGVTYTLSKESANKLLDRIASVFPLK